MSPAAAAARAAVPRDRLWPLAALLAATLAGLWLAVQLPPAVALLTPLGTVTAAATAHMLAVFGLPVMRELNVLVHAGGFACEIDIACTALIPAALLSAAILSRSRSWPARLAGAGAGIAALVLVNQLRLVSLVWIGVHAPQWFDVMHAWVWPLLLAFTAGGLFLAWWRVAPGRA